CAPLLLFSLRQQALPKLLVAVAVFGAALTVALLMTAIPADARMNGAAHANESEAARPGLFVTIALAVLFFIYVGMEVSFSFWAATFAKRLGSGTEELATLAPMFFFSGLMSGRALTPVILNRIRENRLALTALCLVVASGASLVSASSQK